jgi:tetratricopeptide (TPR) repeat protein
MLRLFSIVFALLAGFLAAPARADDRSVCLDANTAPDIAIEACGRLISSRRLTGSDLTQVYSSRGVAFLRMNDHDRAIADYSEMIRLDPRNAHAYDQRGFSYNQKGDYDRAIVDLNEAIRLDPKFVKAYNNRGFAYFIKGSYDSAITDFSEMIRLDSKDPATYLNRGFAYEEKGELQLALADFRMTLSLDPGMRTRAGILAAEGLKRVEQRLAADGGAK